MHKVAQSVDVSKVDMSKINTSSEGELMTME